MKEYNVPLWEKLTLTVEEAVAYSGIGRDKIKEISNEEGCKFVLWVGGKRMIKRKLFEEFLNNTYSV